MTAAVRPAGESAPHAVKNIPGHGKRAAAAHRAQQHERHGLRRNAEKGERGPQQRRECVDRARSAQRADRRKQTHEHRRNAPHGAKPLESAVGESGKNVRSAKERVSPNAHGEQRGEKLKKHFHGALRKSRSASSPRPRPPQTISTPRAEYRTRFPRRRPSAAPRRSSGGAEWTRC